MKRPLQAAALPLIAVIAAPFPALADAAGTAVGIIPITVTTGPDLYRHVCQGCHMPGGVGAVGAARFPALANDSRLAAPSYPIYRVLNGHGGMPWFNGVLSNEQIANVVGYIRTQFGNHYVDPVTPAQVAALRGPAPILER